MTPEELELLSELTIIIPTYNRPLELERAIEYWRDTPVKVHILDGSEKPWFADGVLKSMSTIVYHHVPPRTNEHWMENYSRRMRIASGLPTTKVSVLCADDDFFSISGLIQAIEMILNNREIDAVVGICSEYKHFNSGLVWNLRYTDWREGLNSQSDDVAERVLDRSGAFYLYYAIMRANLMRSVLHHTFKYAYLHDYSHEHLFNSIAAAHCKVSVQRNLIWFKKVWEPNPGVSDQTTRVRDADWFRDKVNRNDVKFITDHMAEGIESGITKANSSLSARVIAERYIKSISPVTDTANFRNCIKLVMGIVVSRLRFVPDNVKLFINSLLPIRIRVVTGSVPHSRYQHLTKNNFFLFDELLVKIANTDIGFVGADFTTIEELLLKPREELRLKANI